MWGLNKKRKKHQGWIPREKAIWGHRGDTANYKPRKENSGEANLPTCWSCSFQRERCGQKVPSQFSEGINPETPWFQPSWLQPCGAINFVVFYFCHLVSGILLWQPWQANMWSEPSVQPEWGGGKISCGWRHLNQLRNSVWRGDGQQRQMVLRELDKRCFKVPLSLTNGQQAFS